MAARTILLGALLVASLSYLLSLTGKTVQHDPYIQGRNKTVLFITNCEHGLSNVHLATSFSLLENYPDLKVHYASFATVEKRLERISSFAQAKTAQASPIVFHEVKGLSFVGALIESGRSFTSPPGSAGIASLTEDFQLWLSPWSIKDHMVLFEGLSSLIDEVDPAVIVLDTWFRPAIDATRIKNRQHAFVTPNVLSENFLGVQALPSRLWKFPAQVFKCISRGIITDGYSPASGFSFPIPWRHIPENIYLNIRFIYSAMMTPSLSAKKAALKEKGLKESINFFHIHRADVPWITQTTEGAAIIVDRIPPNVTCAGPIVLSGAPAFKQDPELAAWMKRAPTILVNLGSTVAYSEHQARTLAAAITEVLKRTNLQVLWKFNKNGEYSDDGFLSLQPYLDNDRLRMSAWLTADPSSLLETGDIVASVHHGGSNCYHEAIAAGLTQVVLPLWADLYNYAALVETIGVGVWGCRDTSPDWTSECLTSSLLRALDGGPDSISFGKKAEQLGKQVQSGPKGRDIAAREIARLAYVK